MRYSTAMGRLFVFISVVTTTLCSLLIARCLMDDFDPKSLAGKGVVICGASTGIGEELAYHYSRFGAKVVVVARREETLKKVVGRCTELGAQEARYIVADLSTLEAQKEMVEGAKKMLASIDIVVLNHLLHYYDRWTADSDLTKVPKYFAVNTISYINIATLFLPELQKTNGSIIVISSFTGVIGLPRVAPYSANKHALHGFFDSLRQDLILAGHGGLSVSLFVLGFIDTENAVKMTKGKPAESLTRSPADECAMAIIKGGATKQRQIYYPWYLSMVETVHFFSPNFVENIIHVASHEKPLQDLRLFV